MHIETVFQKFANPYRYGFNGQEKDNETVGAGNSYDFGDRIYDARLGRWLSLDLAEKQYTHLSPYGFVANNPSFNIEVDGNVFVTYITEKVKNESTGKLEKVEYKVIFDGTKTTMQQVNRDGGLGTATDYKAGTNQFVDDIVTSYNYIVDNKADVDNAMQQVAESTEEIVVKDRAGAGEYDEGVIRFDFSQGLKVNTKDKTVDGVQSPALGFWSEVYHAYLDKIEKTKLQEFDTKATAQTPAIDLEEEYVHVTKENAVIDALKKSNPSNNEPKRQTYTDGWKNVKTKGVTSTEPK